MSATLKEIFIREAGKAPQVEEKWNVHDLWANSMDEKTAQRILDSQGDQRRKIFQELDWYNSTAKSYEDGIKEGDLRLLGRKVGVIEPHGSLKTKVKRHSAGMFRLRSPKKETSQEWVAEDRIEEEAQHGEL